MRRVNRLVVHHTATSKDKTVEDIRQMHYANGWSDIGYHYVVRYGEVLDGRPVGLVGAHAYGHNTGSIGITTVGNWSIEPMPAETFEALTDMLTELCIDYNLHPAAIRAHRELEGAATECCGLLVDMDVLRDVVLDKYRDNPRVKAKYENYYQQTKP